MHKCKQQNEFLHDTMFVNWEHIHIRASAMCSRKPGRIQGNGLSTRMEGSREGGRWGEEEGTCS